MGELKSLLRLHLLCNFADWIEEKKGTQIFL